MRLAQQFVEGAAGEHLAAEDAAEVAGGGVGCALHGWRGRGTSFQGWSLKFKAGDAAVADAAGDDPLEVAEVGGDVEREAVGGDALRDVNADGGEFALPLRIPPKRSLDGAPG